MNFICLKSGCDKIIEFPNESEPNEWLANYAYASKGEYLHRCPYCGSGMAPESFVLTIKKGNRIFDGDVFRAFARCPNAFACNTFNVYDGDCEDASHVKPKCMHSLFSAVQQVCVRLDLIETRFPKDQGKVAPLNVASKRVWK